MSAWSPQSNGCHRPALKLYGLLSALIVGAVIALLPGAVLGQSKSKKVSMEGVLEVLHEDNAQGGRYHYFLKSAEGRVKLQLPSDGHTGHSHNKDHQTGDRVRVRGEQIGATLALGGGSTSIETLSQVYPNTFGAQKTLVLLVNFQDNPSQPYTTAYAEDVIFNQTSHFHLENSYGQTWLEGDVRGWFTLPISGAACDFNAIYFAARQAATANGIDLTAYNRFIYAFPDTSSCGWWGLGTVGGNPSHAWINGSLQVRVVGHETGHNLGLFHSHALECGAAAIGTGCTPVEYGDTVDIMGSSTGHYNAYQKEWLGWLNYGASPPVTTVDQGGGVFSIDNYETAGANPKAVKVLKSTDPNTGYKDWYYVEHRQALGFDSTFSTNSNVLNGVVIHSGSESSPDTSYLLDMTPATSSWFDPALGVGQSFSDPDSGVTISVLSADTTGASVSVSLGTVQCLPANPSVSLSGGQTAQAGATVNYSITIRNNDIACGASSFDLTTAVPGGWAASLATSLSLNSGASQTLSLSVTSSSTAAAGSYNIGAAAARSTDATATGSASTSYTVSAPAASTSLNVSVSTNSTVITRKKAVTITGHVRSGGLAAAHQTVRFTITKADGSVVTASSVSKKNGNAAFKYRTTLLDPVGTYWVAADAGSAGASSSGLVTTSFVVQ
jgi:Gametolysin peptidase M11/NPCBM-associated, NEW3 domain of alpha-galactosidase